MPTIKQRISAIFRDKRFWAQAGWETPDEVGISFFISTHYTSPGTYDLYIAGVTAE